MQVSAAPQCLSHAAPASAAHQTATNRIVPGSARQGLREYHLRYRICEHHLKVGLEAGGGCQECRQAYGALQGRCDRCCLRGRRGGAEGWGRGEGGREAAELLSQSVASLGAQFLTRPPKHPTTGVKYSKKWRITTVLPAVRPFSPTRRV